MRNMGKDDSYRTILSSNEISDNNEIKARLYLQLVDGVVSCDNIVQNVKDIWSHNMNRNIDKIESLKVCVLPDEDTAKYVINNEVSGSFYI